MDDINVCVFINNNRKHVVAKLTAKEFLKDRTFYSKLLFLNVCTRRAKPSAVCTSQRIIKLCTVAQNHEEGYYRGNEPFRHFLSPAFAHLLVVFI